MTIDEAIAHAREKADKNSACWMHCTSTGDCQKCEQEHKQLGEWLEELKMYRESSYRELHDMVYNKAIDDAKDVILQTLDNEILVDTLHLRLDLLKEGGENEISGR